MASPPQPPPPPIRRFGPGAPPRIDMGLAQRAIETVRNALPYISIGPPLVRYGPAGDVHVDVPLMYHGFALDRVHFDPVAKTPSPKGRPARAWGVQVDVNEVRSVMESLLREFRVVEVVEFREPEAAWVVPLAWRLYLVAHIKVSHDGTELIPDYGLTEEVRRWLV